jgi:hypothetical protein
LLEGEKGVAHSFDFQNAKGRLPSNRAIFSRSSSLSTLRLADRLQAPILLVVDGNLTPL